MARSVLCPKPWDSLYIYTELKQYSFCCVAMFDLPGGKVPSNQEELMELFNSPEYVRYREALASNHLEGTACARCPYFSLEKRNEDPGAIEESFKTCSVNDSEEYKQYISNVKKSYFDGKLVADYTPSFIQFTVSHACNLSCIMCHQEHKAKKETYALADNLISVIDGINWNRIDQVMLSGGEVFFSRDGRAVLEHLYKKEVGGTRIEVYTNGHYIKPNLDGLDNFSNFGMNISIDGHETAYEKVRKGGKWQNLTENIDAYSLLREKHPLWDLSIYCIVMKSTLESCAPLIEFAHSKGAEVYFAPVEGLFEDENLFIFPWLASQDDVRRAAGRAVETAEKLGIKDKNVGGGLSKSIGTVSSLKYIQKLAEEKADELWKFEYRVERFKSFRYYPKIIHRLIDSMRIDEWTDFIKQNADDASAMGLSVADEMKLRYREIKDRADTLKKVKRMKETVTGRNFVVFGAGWCGQDLTTRNISEDWGLCITAVGDEDPAKIGTEINGLPVVDAVRMLEYGDVIIISSKDFEDRMRQFISETFKIRVETVVYDW